MDDDINEQGLLAYNYDVQDPSGQIDSGSIDVQVKDPHKEPMISPKMKGQSNTNIDVNFNNSNQVAATGNPPVSTIGQIQKFLVQLFYWIPIRYLCFLGNIALFIGPILSFNSTDNVVLWLLGWYIQFFALVGVIIESPTWWLTQRLQLAIFFYARFLRRTSGRSGFYFGVFTLGYFADELLTKIAALYLLVLAIVMLGFSFVAAKQLKAMYAYMLSGAPVFDEVMNNEFNGADQVPQRIANYYLHCDRDRTKKVGATQLHAFAQQTLKRKLSNAERHTIQSYLDASCLGYITPEDWTKQFLACNTVKML